MFMKELENILKEAISQLNYDVTNIKVIKSNRPNLCDYQCDDVFKLAKTYGKTPQEIGSQIADKLNERPDFKDHFNEVVFANPGFINMSVSDKFINDNINKMTNDNFNISKPEKEETYFIDYGGPNIAKPLHVGHLRPAIIGESLKRILKFKGYKTISDVHLGDYGLQIGQVIYGILEDKISVEDITIEYLEATYPKISSLAKSDETVLAQCQLITKELQEGNPQYHKLWRTIYNVSLTDIKRIYHNLDVSFDLWNGESDSFPYIPELIKYFESKNIVNESDGAKIIEVKEDTDKKEMPPLILQKSDGAYLYSTTDLATIYERVKKYNPNYILYVVDERQQLHFEQVFRVAKKSGLVPNTKLEHNWIGTMNGPDGKPFKTRDGETLKLEALISEVKANFINLKDDNQFMKLDDIEKIANAIIIYADLQNNRERNYVFDINKFSDIAGKTGPYILYTYLRINKLLNNYSPIELNHFIYNEYDRELRLKLMEFELSIDKSIAERMPSYVADYLYDLCVTANTFYQNNRLMDLEDQIKKEQWLTLLNSTNQVIKKLLDLLVIKTPSIM